MIIRMRDIRAAGMCDRARAWFRLRGLDWEDFVSNGIESETLIATGDALAIRVVEVARGRE